VRYRVAPNASSNRRNGTLSVAGQTFTVEQDGAPENKPDKPDKPDDPKPDKPEKVDVDGNVGSLGGSCPSLAFKVRGEDVTTSGSTKFKGGSCGDVRNGRRVRVKGERRGSEPIRADEVDIDR
jgi:hypothetical protein